MKFKNILKKFLDQDHHVTAKEYAKISNLPWINEGGESSKSHLLHG